MHLTLPTALLLPAVAFAATATNTSPSPSNPLLLLKRQDPGECADEQGFINCAIIPFGSDPCAGLTEFGELVSCYCNEWATKYGCYLDYCGTKGGSLEESVADGVANACGAGARPVLEDYVGVGGGSSGNSGSGDDGVEGDEDESDVDGNNQGQQNDGDDEENEDDEDDEDDADESAGVSLKAGNGASILALSLCMTGLVVGVVGL